MIEDSVVLLLNKGVLLEWSPLILRLRPRLVHWAQVAMDIEVSLLRVDVGMDITKGRVDRVLRRMLKMLLARSQTVAPIMEARLRRVKITTKKCAGLMLWMGLEEVGG